MAEEISKASGFLCSSEETSAYFMDVFPDYPVSREQLSVVGYGNIAALTMRLSDFIVGCEQLIPVYKREIGEARSEMRRVEIRYIRRSNFDRLEHLKYLYEDLIFLKNHYRGNEWKTILPHYRAFNHFAFTHPVMMYRTSLPGYHDAEPEWFPGIALGEKHCMVYHRPSVPREDMERYYSLEPFVVCLNEGLQHFVFRKNEFDSLKSSILSGEDPDFVACFHPETVKRLRDGSVLQLSDEELLVSYNNTVARLLRAQRMEQVLCPTLDMKRIKRLAKHLNVALDKAERFFD
ncbi:MAG: hypothetical protein HGA67_00085 [Candidatus Yonathbacteria bacterium]|nr:hypothetical protein [Candidatus Yonathbacteria bacterium]